MGQKVSDFSQKVKSIDRSAFYSSLPRSEGKFADLQIKEIALIARREPRR